MLIILLLTNFFIAVELCGPPGVGSNAVVQPIRDLYSNQDTVSYTCSSRDQFFNGISIRQCLNNKWSGDAPFCGEC